MQLGKMLVMGVSFNCWTVFRFIGRVLERWGRNILEDGEECDVLRLEGVRGELGGWIWSFENF